MTKSGPELRDSKEGINHVMMMMMMMMEEL